ncbi:MAG: hypothetical protein ACYC9Q_05475 [Bacillota bacterium]
MTTEERAWLTNALVRIRGASTKSQPDAPWLVSLDAFLSAFTAGDTEACEAALASMDEAATGAVQTSLFPLGPATGKPGDGQLIAELTGLLHALPGVQPLKGHFGLVGGAYRKYGYQAVVQAIQDFGIELAERAGMGLPNPLEKELARMLYARCGWNQGKPSEPRRGKRFKDLYDAKRGRVTIKTGPAIPEGYALNGTQLVRRGKGGGEGR